MTRATRKSGTKVSKPRGNQGYFAGKPLQMLQSYLPEYITSLGNREPFWSKFRGEWQRKYPGNLTPEETDEVAEIIIKYRLQRNTGTRKGTKELVEGLSENNEEGEEPRNKPDGSSTVSTILTPTTSTALLKPNYPPVPYPPIDNATPSNLPFNYPPVPYPPIDVSDLTLLPTAATSKGSKGKGRADEIEEDQEEPEVSKEGKSGGRSDRENWLLARAAGQKKVDAWLSFHANKARNVKDNEKKKFVEKLQVDSAGPAPRLVPAYKFYEKHPDFKSKVDDAYKERYGEGSWKISQHVALAKEMFKNEGEETRLKIREEAKDSHRQALEAYEKAKTADPFDLSSPEEVESRRKLLGPVLMDFLNELAKATNTRMHVTIVGEAPGVDENRLFVSTVQAGAPMPGPEPKQFHEWDPVGFKMQHVRSFAEYAKACLRLEKGLDPQTPAQKDSLNELDFTPIPYAGNNDAEPEPTEDSAKAGPSRKRKAKGKGKKADRSKKRARTTKRGRKRDDGTDSSGDEGGSSSFQDADTSDEDEEEVDELKTPPTTPQLRKGRRLGPHLEAQLADMSVGDRRREMGRLAEMTKDRFDREKILARNLLLQKQAGIHEAVEELGFTKDKGKGKEKENGGRKEQRREQQKGGQERRRSTRVAARGAEGQKNPVSGQQNSDVDPDPVSGQQSADVDILIPVSSVRNELHIPHNASACMLTLHSLVTLLPDSLEEAQDKDEVAMSCYRFGPWPNEMSTGEAWETWNGILDTLLQKRSTESQEEYNDRVVKGGEKGTRALYSALAHVMEKVVFDADMLEGKIMRVIEAVKTKCPGIQLLDANSPPITSTTPSASSSTSTSRPRPHPHPHLAHSPAESSPNPETQLAAAVVVTEKPASAGPSRQPVVGPVSSSPAETPAPKPVSLSTRSKAKTASAGPSTGSKRKRNDVATTSQPRWAVDIFTYLRAGITGREWTEAVNALESLEASYTYTSSAKSLNTTCRPQAVHHWISRGRKEVLPSILAAVPPKEFQSDLTVWWNELMPDWRKLDREGPELAMGRWSTEVEGDWGALRNPGINGLSSVFACMKWLLFMHAYKNGQDLDVVDGDQCTDHWRILLDDIKWVCLAMRMAEEGIDGEPPKKRYRCATQEP